MQREAAQTDVSSERTRDGMIFVRAGIFWMGSDHRICALRTPAAAIDLQPDMPKRSIHRQAMSGSDVLSGTEN
jgi:hypothetical protein